MLKNETFHLVFYKYLHLNKEAKAHYGDSATLLKNPRLKPGYNGLLFWTGLAGLTVLAKLMGQLLKTRLTIDQHTGFGWFKLRLFIWAETTKCAMKYIYLYQSLKKCMYTMQTDIDIFYFNICSE